MQFNQKESRVFKKLSFCARIAQTIKRYSLRKRGNVVFRDILILGSVPLIKTPKKGKIILEKGVILNSDKAKSNSALTSNVKLTTGYHGVIKIGECSALNGSCIVAYDFVEIGKYCEIASCTLISDTDFHPVLPEERLKQMKGEPFSFDSVNKAKIKIGDNCWIGYGAIILKGVTIGNNGIVAAGTIVPGGKTFPDNSIIAGNPAHVVKKLK